MYGIIYCATNKINGKIYIGLTKGTLRNRKAGHKTRTKQGIQTYFYNAIRKYGWDNFSWRIIDCSDTKENLAFLEQQYIEMFGSYFSGIGYNMTEGGEGNAQSKPEVIEKLRKSKLGKTHSGWNKGKKLGPLSLEHREKIRKANTGHSVSVETRDKLRKAHTGKVLSEEHKRKIGISGKGKRLTSDQSLARKQNHTKRCRQVQCVETEKIYFSISEAGREINQKASVICLCASGKQKSAGGFHWKYLDKD